MRIQTKPKVPTQRELDVLIRRTRSAVRKLTNRLVDGSVNALQFEAGLSTLLEDSHTAAIGLGRRRAGDHTSHVPDDRLLAQLTLQSEREYLDNFVRDLQTGKYIKDDGSRDDKAIHRRAQMYADRVSGSASEAFVLASHSAARFHWRLGPNDHCPTCLKLARTGPYTDRELPTYPRAGATDCGTKCRCHLERTDGVRGFGPTPKEPRVIREGSDEDNDPAKIEPLGLVADFNGDLEAQEKFIDDLIEEAARTLDREVFVDGTRDGRVYRKIGTKRSHSLTAEEDKMFVGGIKAHTHPGGFPPSPSDFRELLPPAPGVLKIKAKGGKLYVFRRSGQIDQAELALAVRSAWQQADAEYGRANRDTLAWATAFYQAMIADSERVGFSIEEFRRKIDVLMVGDACYLVPSVFADGLPVPGDIWDQVGEEIRTSEMDEPTAIAYARGRLEELRKEREREGKKTA